MTVKVGDPVWVAWSTRGRGVGLRQYVVTKVGRKWAEYADPDYLRSVVSRFDVVSLEIDGRSYSSPGRVWLSPDDWQRAADAQQAWTALYRAVTGAYKPTVTADDIRKAATLLGLELKETP